MKIILSFIVILSSLFSQEEIGIYEKLGKIANTGTVFTTQTGEQKTIKELMDGRATIISMNYYQCPGICSTQFAAVASLIDRLDTPLEQFQVLTISIEPDDTPALAKEKQTTFYDSMKIKTHLPKDKWKFLVSNQENISSFAKSIGYKYKKQIGKNGIVDYLHPGTLVILSPSGKITRYIYGMNYSAFDVKLALIEADEGKINATRVAVLSLCFAYDADSKKYIFQWEKIVGGLMFASVVIFFLYLAITGRKEDKK